MAGTTLLTFVPLSDDGSEVSAEVVQAADVELDTKSRSRVRQPLAVAPSVSELPSTPASQVAPATTSPVAAASPEQSPSTVASSPTPEVVVVEPEPSAVETTNEQTAPPVAAAAPAAEPAAIEEVEPELPALGERVGTRYAVSPVNVRSGPGTDHDVITTIGYGRAVSVTDVAEGNWQQVDLDGEAAWMHADYLSETEPPRERTQEPESSNGLDMSSCSNGAGIESGLTSRTVNVLRAVCNQFPNVSDFGGYRSGGGSYHSSGRAIDVMVSGEAGWEIARWVRANASELGVIEVIYAQNIWTAQRAGDGWRSMSDRGSASANHYDHVHISVR